MPTSSWTQGVSFQYSYTAVSSRDGRTHVQSDTTRFADGKLTRESFEGDSKGTQRQMMSWFLPAVASRAFRQGLIGQGADTDVYRPLAQEKSAQATDLSA